MLDKDSSATQTSVLFPASGDWLDVQCDGDAKITDAATPPKDRFEYAKASGMIPISHPGIQRQSLILLVRCLGSNDG